MEESIFPADVVRAQKQKFVEARLHSDAYNLEQRARIAGLIETVARSTAQPIYVAMNPADEVELGRFSGAVLTSPDPFAGFLEAMLGELDSRVAMGTSKAQSRSGSTTMTASPR